MVDEAHEWTEEEIERLAKRLRHEYSQAEKEMRQKLEKLMSDFDEQNKDWQARMAAGKSTRDEYEAWLKDMSMNREFVGGMADTLAQDAVNADKRAMELINNALPTVYAENANRAAYGIDSALGQDHSFDLYDQSTVRRLISNPEADLLPIQQPPIPNPKVDARKDKPWNKRKFNSAITQSILQGESIPNTAKRLQTVLKMDENAAVRAARTAMTGAENAGRVDSYRRAKAIGIDLEQEWMSTLDMRTRHSHRELDGQHVPVGEKFKVDGIELEFPADPTAPPEYVYNCRCTLVAWFPDLDKDERWSKLPSGMTYDDWKSGKKAEKKRQEAAGVVNGRDIIGTWKRREDKFDFEIEDVLNAQGFDGRPRVVSADEFDEAVKAANGGNGFIAQRTYSAPDQETLDAYRQQLYGGKWYVDCSSGAATFGQGMYCAADYSGVISSQIQTQIDFYKDLYSERGNVFSYVETMTLDPSARVIDYYELRDMQAAAEPDADSWLRNELAKHQEMFKRGEITPQQGMMMDAESREQFWNIVEEAQAIRSMNTSSYAAALGYDAVRVENTAGVTETIILNRTKLIIKEPE